MPDKLVTRGLVLRATETKEADYILNVLTAEHGRLAVIARGARRRGGRGGLVEPAGRAGGDGPRLRGDAKGEMTMKHTLEFREICKSFAGVRVLDRVSFSVEGGEVLALVGENGAGKSTLLNCVAGVYMPAQGKISIGGVDVTRMPEHKRAKLLGRVFQDPMMGTSGNMWIEENLALASRRGKLRTLRWGISNGERAEYKKQLATLGLGLEERLSTKVKLLSGGQRQALTLLMATMNKPKLLLLDEHTAALDPKTAATVLELSCRMVAEHGLTALMVTHNMRDAIACGNRLIMMQNGRIVLDIRGEEKKNLTVEMLLERFAAASGSELANDRMLLG